MIGTQFIFDKSPHCINIHNSANHVLTHNCIITLYSLIQLGNFCINILFKVAICINKGNNENFLFIAFKKLFTKKMSSSITEISSIEELDSISTSTTLTVVYFYADWCIPCDLLAPSIEEMSEEFDGMSFVKVNVDSNKDIKTKHEINVLPACIVLSRGKNIYTFYGSKKDTLEETLSQLKTHYCL